MSLTYGDEFCGFGGSTQGAAAVPGVVPVWAANHNEHAIRVHELNYPGADHILGDVQKPRTRRRLPACDIAWHSPACPPFSDARGERRDFDRSTQPVLFVPDETPEQRRIREELQKRRALMHEVPLYLQAMRARNRPVLAGVVENVPPARKWDQWDRWLGNIRSLGYETRVIALNAMHVRPRRSPRVPQSRNRLFVGYWLRSLGRTPDFDAWLRPTAWCPKCERVVRAMQVWKRPGVDMGTYGRHGQYVYRCPSTTCRNHVVHPEVLSAAAAIDFTLDPGQRIGERVDGKGRPDPLEEATLARIHRGRLRHWDGMLVPAGGTWREDPTSLFEPMPTRTTRKTDALVLSPLLVPTEARDGLSARPASEPLRTQTSRQETALVLPPLVATLRGGGSRESIHTVDDPLTTFSAGGQHHALIQPPEQYLLPYYSGSIAQPVGQPMGTLTTKDRYALIGADGAPAVEDCTFRMLTPPEIARGMGFTPGYKVTGSKRVQVAGYGNAVAPACSEVLVSALVECITGQELDR